MGLVPAFKLTNRRETMSDYIVKRTYNRHGNHDFLTSWDIIWGPVWCGSKARALVFHSVDAACEAAETARVCVQPVPWIVPDLGQSPLSVIPA